MKKAWVLSYPLSAHRGLIRLGGCVFAGRTLILLVLSCHGSFNDLIKRSVSNEYVCCLEVECQTTSVHFNTDMSCSTTKPTKRSVRPATTDQIRRIRVSLCTQWIAKDSSFLQADSEDSDQTGWMPRLIWILAGCTSSFAGFVMLWLNYQDESSRRQWMVNEECPRISLSHFYHLPLKSWKLFWFLYISISGPCES